jgi:hypothetical protein
MTQQRVLCEFYESLMKVFMGVFLWKPVGFERVFRGVFVDFFQFFIVLNGFFVGN